MFTIFFQTYGTQQSVNVDGLDNARLVWDALCVSIVVRMISTRP